MGFQETRKSITVDCWFWLCRCVLLVHDSNIFADVDERQKAHALELSAKESKDKGFQYICALNSDTLPINDFSDEFKLDKYVRLILTDSTPDGGLLGIRF